MKPFETFQLLTKDRIRGDCIVILSSHSRLKKLFIKGKKKSHESGLNSHSSHMMGYTTVALMTDLSKENGVALKPNCEGDNAFYCLV